MNEHRIGCSTSTFRYAPLDDALDRIAASGVKMVDLWMAPHWCPHFDPVSATPLAKRELRERFQSRGLEPVSCRVTSGTFLINDEQGPEIEGRYQRRSLELAADVGVPLLLVSTGRDTWDSTFERNARLVADHLNALGKDAQAMGVRLGIVCPHVSQLGQFFDRAKRLIAMTDPEYVGVALDTAHVRLSGGTLAAALDAYGRPRGPRPSARLQGRSLPHNAGGRGHRLGHVLPKAGCDRIPGRVHARARVSRAKR